MMVGVALTSGPSSNVIATSSDARGPCTTPPPNQVAPTVLAPK